MKIGRRNVIAGAVGATVAGWWRESSVAADGESKPEPKKEERRDPYADAVFQDGEPPLPADGSFTFAVLPDTQHYSEKYPRTFTAQTEWLVAQRGPRRIAGVFHLGDITNRNTPAEWTNARDSMRRLTDTGLPCCLVPGNHDYGPGGNGSDRTTLFDEYFPVADRKRAPDWGGCYDREPDRGANTFHLLESAGRRFLVLGLEFGPRADVVRWANEVVAGHADCEVVLLTHAYVYHDDTRFDWQRFGKKQAWNPHVYGMAKASQQDVHDGQQLWEKLVARHRNVILAVSGHVLGDGLGRVVTAAEDGREIPQLLVNFQMRPNGGDGWLRLIEVRPDGTAQTYDYSPTLRRRNAAAQNQFTVRLPAVARQG